MTSERVFPFDSYVLFFPAPRGMCSAGPRRAFCTLTVSLSFPSVNIIHFLPPSHPPLPPPPHLPPVSERGRYNTAYLVSKKVGEIFFFSFSFFAWCVQGGRALYYASGFRFISRSEKKVGLRVPERRPSCSRISYFLSGNGRSEKWIMRNIPITTLCYYFCESYCYY